MQRVQLLGLYRRILRNAKAFPSVRRDRMVQEIREGACVGAGGGVVVIAWSLTLTNLWREWRL